MKVGSYVLRKKYQGDILFKIVSLVDNVAILDGVYIRLIATAPISDLLIVSKEELDYYKHIYNNKTRQIASNYNFSKKHITGKILHIDGDLEYLYKCHKLYSELGLYSVCVLINTSDISDYICDLVRDYQIDIVVITGHDSYNNKGLFDLGNYKSSSEYVKAVKKLRTLYSKDELYIFAGACASNFEALIAAGANAASSPKRVNIDAYDPAICAVKAATTPFDQIISFDSIWAHSLTKEAGISGIESYGKMRILR